MSKYLLSTGNTTTKIEKYVLDLFRMNLVIRPNDIPHYNTLGFNFSLIGITKDRIKEEVTSRIEDLITEIQSLFDKNIVKISLGNVAVLNEETVSITINVNNYVSEEIILEL